MITSSIDQEDDGAAGVGPEGVAFEGVAGGGALFGVDDDAGHGAAVVGDAEVGDSSVVVGSDVLRREHPHVALLDNETRRNRGKC